MVAINVRNIDIELRKRLKMYSVKHDKTMEEVVIEAIEKYIGEKK